MTRTKSFAAPVKSVLESSPLNIDELRAWLGLTQSELGAIVGRDRRSVARWGRTDDARTSARGDAARSLRRLARVQYLLGDLTDSTEARRWLRAPSPALRGEAAIDLLEGDRIEEVIAVLEALADGGEY